MNYVKNGEERSIPWWNWAWRLRIWRNWLSISRIKYKWLDWNFISILGGLDTFNEVQPTWVFAKQIRGLTLFVEQCVQGILVLHISPTELLKKLVVFLCFGDHAVLSFIKRVHLKGLSLRYNCDLDLLLICAFLFRRWIAAIYVQGTYPDYKLLLYSFSGAFLGWDWEIIAAQVT